MSESKPVQASGRQPSRAIGALSVELRQAILRTSRRLRQERSADDLTTPSQFSVLGALEARGPLNLCELASHERVQPPSMTRMITTLEELGLASRTPHPTDGRQIVVSLTDQGRAVVYETRKQRSAWLAKRIAELTVEERDTLRDAARILDRIAES